MEEEGHVHLVLRVDPSTGEILEAEQTSTPFDAQEIDSGGRGVRTPDSGLGGERSGRTQPLDGSDAGAGPPNDSCFEPLEVFDGRTEYTRVGATTDGPAHPGLCQRDGQTHDDVWFLYRASCDGTVAITTCRSFSDFDTDLVVYSGDVDLDGDTDDADCAAILTGDVLPLACNDDAEGCDSFNSAVELPALAGDPFLIRLGGMSGVAGQGLITITCAPPPQNDDV